MTELLRLFETLRWLKPVQMVNRVTRAAWVPAPTTVSGAVRRSIVRLPVSMPPKKASWVDDYHLEFLGCSKRIESPQIWNDESVPKLWLYHLHYFDDVLATDSELRRPWHRALIKRWIRENPPADGNGWEPYPTAIRTSNWIKWSLSGEVFDADVLDSLATQLRWLRRRVEYHLLGNHLFENARALLIGGCYFEGNEADEWLAFGRRLLSRELEEQVLPDGGHFELSPMYHALVLEGVLDVINVSRVYGVEAPDPAVLTVRNMLRWLSALSHADGEIALLNDSALGVAQPLATLVSYARSLGIPVDMVPPNRSVLLPDSGHARLVAGDTVVIADAGAMGPDYIPGHAHADTLTFELAVGRRRVIVDSGVSTYESSPERLRQRGTAAHNTLMIDGQNSSDVWKAFRLGRRARIVRRHFEASSDRSCLEAAHDGYRHLGIIHRRCWVVRFELVDITDEVQGGGTHLISSRFHLHPAIRAQVQSHVAVLWSSGGDRIATLELAAALDWRIETSTYHPQFGVCEDAMALVGENTLALPQRFETTVHVPSLRV